MLTKAIIKELPKRGSNIFKVRIPYLEDNSRNEVIRNATYCMTPGVYNGLNVNDIIFISFEDDKIDKPVILGKLFVNKEPSTAQLMISTCSVSDHIDLPDNTTISGYGAQDFMSFSQLRPGGTK